jgi:hypothetical protein
MAEIPKDSGVAPNIMPLVRMSLDEALDKINVLEASTKALDVQLKQVTEERNQVNSVLTAQVRAAFLNKARALTQIPETQLHKMGNDELESIVKLAEQIKRPNPKSYSKCQGLVSQEWFLPLVQFYGISNIVFLYSSAFP